MSSIPSLIIDALILECFDNGSCDDYKCSDYSGPIHNASVSRINVLMCIVQNLINDITKGSITSMSERSLSYSSIASNATSPNDEGTNTRICGLRFTDMSPLLIDRAIDFIDFCSAEATEAERKAAEAESERWYQIRRAMDTPSSQSSTTNDCDD